MNILDELVLQSLANGQGISATRLGFTPVAGRPYRNPGYPDLVDGFMANENQAFLHRSIHRHWTTVSRGERLQAPLPVGGAVTVANYGAAYAGPNLTNDGNFDYLLPLGNGFHLVTAFLIENTGLFSVFRALIEQFQTGEFLGKAGLLGTPVNIEILLHNTEQLFFDDTGSASVSGRLTSSVRPSSLATRQNAYHRLLGSRLHWDDRYGPPVPFVKAPAFNASCVVRLEALLRLFWEHFMNARNTGGPNASDPIAISEAARDLRLELMARRSEDPVFNGASYGRYLLSRVEYYSVVHAYWLAFALRPQGPLATWARLDGNRAGTIVSQLGSRLGVPVHSKASELLDLSWQLAHFLRRIEEDYYERPATAIAQIAIAHVTGAAALLPEQTLILSIISNWQIATGTDIKGIRVREPVVVRAHDPRPLARV